MLSQLLNSLNDTVNSSAHCLKPYLLLFQFCSSLGSWLYHVGKTKKQTKLSSLFWLSNNLEILHPWSFWACAFLYIVNTLRVIKEKYSRIMVAPSRQLVGHCSIQGGQVDDVRNLSKTNIELLEVPPTKSTEDICIYMYRYIVHINYVNKSPTLWVDFYYLNHQGNP